MCLFKALEEFREQPTSCNLITSVTLPVCLPLSTLHPSTRPSTRPSQCRGMVIHSSHMQIAVVRLGRPWERITAPGFGPPTPPTLQPPLSYLLSNHPTPSPPPLHLHLHPTTCFLQPPRAVQSLTHLPFLPRADLQSVECVEVEDRLRQRPI